MINLKFFETDAITHVYTDGGVVGRNPSDFGGTWAFVAVDSNDQEVFRSSGFHKTQGQATTNNHTELIAVIEALEAMPEGWTGTIVSDSQITLGRVFSGWRMKNVPEEYVERLRVAKERLGKISGKHVDGHPTKAQLESGLGKRNNSVSKWNVLADQLCNDEIARVRGKKI